MMKNYNIITLGASGAGKTVFLASLFKQLSIAESEGFFLKVQSDKQRKELNDIYAKIMGKGAWPQGTRTLTKWQFTCCIKTPTLVEYEVCQFTYIDYGGGLITDILEDEQEEKFSFQEEVPKADAVLAIIDGQKLLKFMENKNLSDQDFQDFMIWSQKDLRNTMILADKCRQHTPVHFIISKWDLLEHRYNLSKVKERLGEIVPEFNHVVNNRVRAKCPVRLIPISAIGSDFATLQADGSMEKNPRKIPQPFHLEITIAYVLLDGVKNTLKTKREGIKDSFKGELFDNLTKFFITKEAELLSQEREKLLEEVKNEETALDYLVYTFLKHIKNFEYKFPTANLGGEIFEWKPTLTLARHKELILSVGFTSDGETVFSSSHDRSVRFWELPSGKLQKIIRETSGWVRANISKENQLLFTTCGDKSIKIWDIQTGKPLHEKPLQAHYDLINAFVVSSDGRTLISASRNKTVKVWKMSNNSAKLLYNYKLIEHQGLVYALAVCPNWRIFASGGSDKKVLLWDLHSGKLLHTLYEHPGYIRALTFSPDGKILVSGGYGKTIYVWDSETFNLKLKLEEHKGTIFSLAISPDNHILASGSVDRTIKLWNLSTGTLITTLTGHTGMITALSFSPDNQTLASGSKDKKIKIWQIT